MRTKPRTTIRDIAARAGVHFSTVSRALRNDPRLTAKTKRQIRALAKTLGYSPDPAVTALAAYRSSNLRATYSGTIAWLTTNPTREGWKVWPDFSLLHQGALQRAGELGYVLEELWLQDLGGTAARVTRTLTARGIAGIMIPPRHADRGHIRLDWSRFSALSLSHSISYPRLHLATGHQYRSMVILMRQLRKLGYRRIALALLGDQRVDHNWLAAYLVEQRRLNPEDRIPDYNTYGRSDDEITHWLTTCRPDVVVSQDHELPRIIREIGWKIPHDIGVAYPDCSPQSEVSGVTQNFHKVGEVAFDYLVGMLHRGERGIPSIPIRLLVEGTWVEGTTVRRLNSSKAKKKSVVSA